jgi:predicted MPP superfamily phosphohydrolase
MTNTATTSDPDVLRWLHVTDLHFGKNDESQRTAITSLVATILKFSDEKPFDLVLLTGDLAYSGKREEYDALHKEFIDPLRASPLFCHAQFHAAPGNHDLNCDIGYPPVWNSIGTTRQEKFFHLDESGRNTRATRAAAFQEYKEFTARANVFSVDPTLYPAAANYVLGKSRKFAVISTVTAFFSDKEVNDRQKAPAPVHPIRTLIQQVPLDVVKIVIGHHPGDWFTQDSDRQLHSVLVDGQAIYLHGHEHYVRPKFGGRGLTSLGFGAAYQAPSEAQPNSIYKNSFAICEMAEALHVQITSWDATNGQWRKDSNLPADFQEKSHRLADGYSLPLAITRLLDQPNRAYAKLASAIRSEVRFDTCIWLAGNDSKRWADLLSSIGQLRNVVDVYTLPSKGLPAGHSHFRVRDQQGLYLIYAVSGQGDVLTYEQLEAINTDLDKQDYTGSIVVTLGTLAEGAQILAAQLQSRKPIVVLERATVVRGLIRSFGPELSRLVAQTDSATTSGSLIVTNSGFAILFQDRTTNAWFSIIDDQGNALPESSELVRNIRVEAPQLRTQRYQKIAAERQTEIPMPNDASKFDRDTYLNGNRNYFDDVKYAPLAALGFRFRNASLEQIYVDASANVAGSSKRTHNLNRAVSEFLDSLSLPKAQRDQLESQLRSRYGLDRTSEVGAARQLYQRFNNVVVLGDPGSGKTCFVKHELLAYCAPAAEKDSWYAYHVPVYVALSEAARLLSEDTDLLAVCETVTARRGLVLPRNFIEQALTEGRVAFFFDGLDEVGFIDKRIALMVEIDKLVKAHAHKGNRFVLTSRPAALQPVDIPEAMTFLQLNGLTEEEMRTLAGRVLTIRLGEGEQNELTDEEGEIVERLLEDTRNSPGIARIARNPLLLTLLVLIYANSGALSAKRHLIYAQAIKTLVSVRGRTTREQQISEADLRSRLGAIAVAIFNREIAEIPKRSEVARVLSPHLPASSIGTGSSADTANAFIQEVAEATGLLTIHAQEASGAEDLITFMHYSFLEYYAAAGLLVTGYLDDLERLAGNPRWKDVVTLLFGVLSEQGDVTPALKKLLSDASAAEAITNQKLLLALNCACECDVAPEAAQDLLAKFVYESLVSGAARYSADLRDDLAANLEYFLQGAGPRVETAVVMGLRHENPMVVAATCDLVARLPIGLVTSSAVQSAFAVVFSNTNTITRCAALYAIERRPELRSGAAEEFVRRSLSRSVVEKHAALEAIGAVPAFALAARDDVLELLDDTNVLVSQTAAQCLLTSSLQGAKSPVPPGTQERILAKLNQSEHEANVSFLDVTLDVQTVESLMTSSSPTDVELAIRYMPLVRDDSQFVYQTLSSNLKNSTTSRHVAACLDSLRICTGAMSLITIADTNVICGFRKAKERNIRIAAIKLLGEMPDDEQVIQNLRDHLAELAKDVAKEDELTEVAKALGAHVRRNPRLRDEVLTGLLEHLPKTVEAGFGDDTAQRHLHGLLLVCEAIGGVADNIRAQRLLAIAESFKTPLSIRKQAMRVFGRIVEPSEETVRTFVRLLSRNDIRTNDALYAAAAAFSAQCRRRVDYMRRVYPTLDGFRDQLCAVWRRELGNSIESIDQAGLRDIRAALIEVENLAISFEEFSTRKTVNAR